MTYRYGAIKIGFDNAEPEILMTVHLDNAKRARAIVEEWDRRSVYTRSTERGVLLRQRIAPGRDRGRVEAWSWWDRRFMSLANHDELALWAARQAGFTPDGY